MRLSIVLKDRELRSISFALAVILSMIVLFRPGSDGPLPFPQADKVIHATTFGLLAATAWLRFKRAKIIALCLIAYAVGSEIIQHFWIPGREFELLDILADLAGGFVILVSIRKMR